MAFVFYLMWWHQKVAGEEQRKKGMSQNLKLLHSLNKLWSVMKYNVHVSVLRSFRSICFAILRKMCCKNVRCL